MLNSAGKRTFFRSTSVKKHPICHLCISGTYVTIHIVEVQHFANRKLSAQC